MLQLQNFRRNTVKSCSMRKLFRTCSVISFQKNLGNSKRVFSYLFCTLSALYIYHTKSPNLSRWSADTVGAPKLLDVYSLTDDIIGEGGYGMVTKGICKRTGVEVAVKEMSKRETSAKDFWAEVDLLRIAGKHDNIMSLLGAYETNENWYIVMELANEGELFDNLVNNGAYSEKEASETLRALCDALQHLHRKGIVHGDIKPENILLHHRKMCLVDFGVSFRMGERASGKKFTGTVAYAAPEVLQAEISGIQDDIGPSGDIFALGIVMYILLCGVHPFDKCNSLSDDQIMKNIVHGKVDLESEDCHFLSDSAKDLIQRLLDPNPKTRITAAEALQHPWLQAEAKLDTAPVPDLAEHLAKFQRGRRRLRASILAVLLDALPLSENETPVNAAITWGVSSNSENATVKAAQVMSTLRVFDRENKGYISPKDLQRVASDYGESLNDDDISEMVTAADGDPDNAPGEVAYDDVKMAVCSLRSSTFENGETIVREGTTDNRFYYLMDGEVEVSCRSIEQDKKLTQPIVLRRLKSGSVFGEAELLKPGGNVHPRFSSYKCVAPSCKVLTLLQDDLAAITGVFSEINSKIQGRVSEHAHEQLIKSIQHAKGHVRRVHYEKGDKIVVEGENSDLFYIIVDGKVQVTQQGSVLETLSTGEYFPLGVSGRLQKQNIVQRSATVTCLEPTKLVEISGDAFRSFLCSHRFMSAFFHEQVQLRATKRMEQSGAL